MEMSDLAHAVGLALPLYSESPTFSGLCPENPERHLLGQFIIWMRRPEYAVWVADWCGTLLGGMAAHLYSPWYTDRLVSCDVVLYLAPERRGGLAAKRLIKTYIRWARDNGAEEVLIGNQTGIESERTLGLYERCGFTRVGYNLRHAEVIE